MNFDTRIGKNKAFEIRVFEKSYCVRHDFHWRYRGKGKDHPGFDFYLILFNCTIIELWFYDTRHAENIQ